MESITITVPPDIAQAYNRADATQQAQLQQLITAFFSQASIDDPLGEIIHNLQTQAAANGLTQEILDDILRDV